MDLLTQLYLVLIFKTTNLISTISFTVVRGVKVYSQNILSGKHSKVCSDLLVVFKILLQQRAEKFPCIEVNVSHQ